MRDSVNFYSQRTYNQLKFSAVHYPYGMLQPGRNSQSENYRYSFQGQEADHEVKGVGNSVNYKYRMHDPRLGRFFAVDPLTSKYPHYTPYQFSGNKLIHAVELEGLEERVIIMQEQKRKDGHSMPLKAVSDSWITYTVESSPDGLHGYGHTGVLVIFLDVNGKKVREVYGNSNIKTGSRPTPGPLKKFDIDKEIEFKQWRDTAGAGGARRKTDDQPSNYEDLIKDQRIMHEWNTKGSAADIVSEGDVDDLGEPDNPMKFQGVYKQREVISITETTTKDKKVKYRATTTAIVHYNVYSNGSRTVKTFSHTTNSNVTWVQLNKPDGVDTDAGDTLYHHQHK